MSHKPRLGLWIDDSPKSLRNPAYWDLLVDHGFTTAAIMLESVGKGFDPKYSLQDLLVAKSLAVHSRDIELVLTAWPEPNNQYLLDFEKKIGGYLHAAGAAGLEFDLESNWIPSKVKGFPNLDKAGNALVSTFHILRNKHDVRMEATTFTMHRENSRFADVAPHADRLLPQGYSVRNRTEGLIAFDGPYGPGNMQKLTFDRALEAASAITDPTWPRPKLSCGLAAYDQKWPGKTGEEAMRVAYEAALRYEPEEIRFWSSKWVLGNKKNGYASRFIKSLST